MGWPRNAVHDSHVSGNRLASCVIVSWFGAALNLDTYPLSNLFRPRCAERDKPGRGKPVRIMHIGFFACFHAIFLERSCGARIYSRGETQTHRMTIIKL